MLHTYGMSLYICGLMKLTYNAKQNLIEMEEFPKFVCQV